MPRTARIAPGGIVFHVLNRAVGQGTIFETAADYAAFEKVMARTIQRVPMRLLAYCLMPNHWHLVLWPRGDGDLGRFMQRLTATHVRRWRLHRHSVGQGHLYQGTYKSLPVQGDVHFLTRCRYVERNAKRANLVKRAEHWPWCSLGCRGKRDDQDDRPGLASWPVPRPRNWVGRVNQVESAAELEALRQAIRRGQPFGAAPWQKRTGQRLGLQSTFRPRGRPRKERGN